MIELSKILEQYRAGERGMPTYDELAALLGRLSIDQVIDGMYAKVAAGYQIPERMLRNPVPLAIFQSPEQNEQLARDAQAILDASGIVVTPETAPVQPVAVPDGISRTAAIKDAVNRFLGWKLPKNFSPDNGIAFYPPEQAQFWPIGTNLFTADEATAMFEHCIATPAAQGDAKELTDEQLMVALQGIYHSDFQDDGNGYDLAIARAAIAAKAAS